MTDDSADATTRRSLLAGAAGLAAASTVPAVSAQSDNLTTEAAIPEGTPTLGEDDYTGLFLHVAGPGGSSGSEGVSTCAFADNDGNVVTWKAYLVNKTGDHRQTEVTLHATQGDKAVQGGKLFAVNDQQSCSGNYVQLSLEQIGASEVDYGESGDGASGDGGSISAPGFGPVAGLAGLLGAGWLANRRDD